MSQLLICIFSLRLDCGYYLESGTQTFMTYNVRGKHAVIWIGFFMDTIKAWNYVLGHWAECPNLLHYFARKMRTSILFTNLKTHFNFCKAEFCCLVSHLWLCNPIDCMQHSRLPCPSPSLSVCSNSCPLSWWCHPTISSSHPLLLLPSIFPSIRAFFSESPLQVAKVLELQHQSFQWIFKVDFL